MGYKTVKPRHEKQKEIQNKKIYNDKKRFILPISQIKFLK